MPWENEQLLGAVWGPPQVAQSLRLCSDFSSAVSSGVPGGICEDSNLTIAHTAAALPLSAGQNWL